jgi:hypothetical protein
VLWVLRSSDGGAGTLSDVASGTPASMMAGTRIPLRFPVRTFSTARLAVP